MRVLESVTATVTRVTSDAVVVLKSNADIDVLFTDIALKEAPKGGLKLAHKAVRLRPGIHVVYSSGQPLTDRMRNGFVEGSEFLPKPCRKGQVLEAVGRWN